VRALVLANTAASYPTAAREGFLARATQVRDGGMAAVVDAALQRYLSPEFQQQHPVATAELRGRLLRCEPAAYAACCEALATVDWHAGLAGIQVPTWIVSGAADLAAPPALQQALTQGIAHARLTVLPCAHLPTLEQPEAFTAGLDAFIADCVATGSGSAAS
jgi:3-oxoadipate enol-lactonase